MNDIYGHLMIDIEGCTLSDQDIKIIKNPLVGGIILFARNYASPRQLATLCADIRALAQQPILIAVDHEGGRVQRFGEPLTSIPPMGLLGRYYDRDPQAASELAFDTGRLIAAELGELGLDFSFTPVLDRDYGISQVIGDRSFHLDIAVIVALASQLVAGLHHQGMAAVGKHFPGHGAVSVDSHIGLPIDQRELTAIWSEEIPPFRSLIEKQLDAIMPAHVIYDKADPIPAGFSRYWMQAVLREQLGFTGVIFSDDLSMQAAHIVGSIVDRVEVATQAGCDMLIICNDRASVLQVLKQYSNANNVVSRQSRLATMRFTPPEGAGDVLLDDSERRQIQKRLGELSALHTDPVTQTIIASNCPKGN